MKRWTAMILTIALAAALLAGCGQQTNTEPPAETAAPTATTTPQTTPEPTEEPEPDKGPMPHDEYERAVWYGFLPDDMADMDRDAQVTWKQYCEMIRRMIALQDGDLAEQWAEKAKLALTNSGAMNKDQGCYVLYDAMELMGLEVVSEDYNIWGQVPNVYDYPYLTDWDEFSRDSFGAFDGDDYQRWYSNVENPDYGNTARIQMACLVTHRRESIISGELLFDPEVHVNTPLSMRDALLSVVRLYESQRTVAQPIWNKWQSDIEAEVASRPEAAEITARREAILNSETTIVKANTYIPGETYTGTAYYVSNSGDDSNDGRNPATAWATLERAKNHGYQYGDALFLERGGLYRGDFIKYTEGLTVSAYGTGAKPVVTTSPENAADPAKWILYSEKDGAKVWKYYKNVMDCGMVVFDDTKAGCKIVADWSGYGWVNRDGTPFDIAASLTKDLDFFNDDGGKFAPGDEVGMWLIDNRIVTDEWYGPLYLRCDAGNPGGLFEDIELAAGFAQVDEGMKYFGNIMATGAYGVMDNICFKYYPMSAIDYSDDQLIQNCEFAWGGGCNQVRLNGVAGDGFAADALVGASMVGIRVLNNYFHDNGHILDCENDGPVRDVEISGNLAERTEGLNYGMRCSIENLVLSDNIFTRSGLTWNRKSYMRGPFYDDLNYLKDIRIRIDEEYRLGVTIKDNAFYDWFMFSQWIESGVPGEMPIMSGNRFYPAQNSHYFAYYAWNSVFANHHTVDIADAEDFLRSELHDETSEIIY